MSFIWGKAKEQTCDCDGSDQGHGGKVQTQTVHTIAVSSDARLWARECSKSVIFLGRA